MNFFYVDFFSILMHVGQIKLLGQIDLNYVQQPIFTTITQTLLNLSSKLT